MSPEIAEIMTIESYMATLREHPKGKTLAYPLRKAMAYNGFHNAKTRLKKLGRDFDFEIILINGEDYLKVKRLK